MTSIKPPIKPPGAPTIPVDSTVNSTASAGATGTRFSERATSAEAPRGPASPTAAALGPSSTAAIVEGLREGRIAPADAVRQLTEAAMARGRVPTALRGAVEAQMQAFLQRDPTVAALLRAAGASLHPAEE